MPDRPRFGPAGIPYNFKQLKAPTSELPSFLRDEGLDALEYEAVRWGQKPQINHEEANKLGANAAKHDVWLTMHSSYYINLLSSPETVEASKKRLLATAQAAKWMQAHTIAFHPGYYTRKQSHTKDLQDCKRALGEVVAIMWQTNVEANLGPETSGKLSQLGSLEEILTICESVEQTQPVIDWAHLHARQRGSLRTADDFQKVVETVEKRLGTEAAKNLHCHFSHIEYTFRGERRHHPLEALGYGPKFEPLAEIIIDQGLTPVIISETPFTDEDAKKMRDVIYRRMADKLAVLR